MSQISPGNNSKQRKKHNSSCFQNATNLSLICSSVLVHRHSSKQNTNGPIVDLLESLVLPFGCCGTIVQYSIMCQVKICSFLFSENTLKLSPVSFTRTMIHHTTSRLLRVIYLQYDNSYYNKDPNERKLSLHRYSKQKRCVRAR